MLHTASVAAARQQNRATAATATIVMAEISLAVAAVAACAAAVVRVRREVVADGRSSVGAAGGDTEIPRCVAAAVGSAAAGSYIGIRGRDDVDDDVNRVGPAW